MLFKAGEERVLCGTVSSGSVRNLWWFRQPLSSSDIKQPLRRTLNAVIATTGQLLIATRDYRWLLLVLMEEPWSTLSITNGQRMGQGFSLVPRRPNGVVVFFMMAPVLLTGRLCRVLKMGGHVTGEWCYKCNPLRGCFVL